MNWIKKILGLKTEKQCAIHNVSTRFLIRYIENGILEVEHTTYIYANSEEQAIDKFWKFYQNEAYLDILDVNVC